MVMVMIMVMVVVMVTVVVMVSLPNITRWKMLRPSPAFFLRLNLCTSLRIAMCSQKPGWFSSLIKVSLLLATSFYRAESSIPKMFILHADDTSTQKLEWWNKAWKICFHREQNICKVRLGLQIHFCQTLCSPIWIPCNSKRYQLTKLIQTCWASRRPLRSSLW